MDTVRSLAAALWWTGVAITHGMEAASALLRALILLIVDDPPSTRERGHLLRSTADLERSLKTLEREAAALSREAAALETPLTAPERATGGRKSPERIPGQGQTRTAL